MRVKMTMLLAAVFFFASWMPASTTQGDAQPITIVKNEFPSPAQLFQNQMESTQDEVSTLPVPKPKPDNAGQWEDYTATWYAMGTTTWTDTHVTEGRTIAVDPKRIPMGSTVEVKFQDGSVHTYKAEDTGSAIHGRIIDIYLRSEKQCFRNGRQKVQIRVIRGG